MHQLRTAIGPLHLHLLGQIQVKETCTPVAQHILHQFEGICLQRVGLLSLPTHPDLLGLRSHDSGILGLGQHGLLREHGLTHISTGFPT